MAKQTGAALERKLEDGIERLAPGRHGFGAGLWLEVGARSRAWGFRFMVAGRARSMGLGAWPVVSLADARAKVLDARRQLAAGTDPIDQRRAERGKERIAAARGTTFRSAAEAYIIDHEAGWRNPKSAGQWRASLKKYAYPKIGNKACPDVTIEDVLAILRPIWTRLPETATRVRGRIEVVLASAAVLGKYSQPNPAAWGNNLKMILPPRSKVRPVVPHAAVDWREMPAFMAKLRQQAGFGALCLQFTILTAARSFEARAATWDEIDLTAKTWTVPATRMKAARPHVVPLNDLALEVVSRAAEVRSGDLIFPGARHGRPLSDAGMSTVMSRLGRTETIHGFRASLKTWGSDETEFAREVIEAALSHVIGDKAEQSYQRGSWLEPRRKLMQAWGEFCGSGAVGETGIGESSCDTGR